MAPFSLFSLCFTLHLYLQPFSRDSHLASRGEPLFSFSSCFLSYTGGTGARNILLPFLSCVVCLVKFIVPWWWSVESMGKLAT